MTNKAVATTKTCGVGFYTGDKAAATSADCRTCPAGYYCPDGSVFPTPCPIGYYSSSTGGTSSAACLQATAGYVQPWLGYTRATTPIQCPNGSVCAAGTSTPY